MNDPLSTIDHGATEFRESTARDSVTFLVVAYGLLTVLLGILLGPSLIGDERLAFRDVSHFYTPLYEYVAARQSEAWLPLWNPLDLNGMPLAGETTTAVFYPVRMLVYKLASSSTVAIAWYIAIHLLIASVAVHVAAKSIGVTRFGCAVAVIVYPLAGPVFFLIYNPPYLVGAAWLPLAVAGGICLLKRFSMRWIAITAFSLAMPVLGGDPQTTIHVLMIGGIVSLFHFAKSVRVDRTMAVRTFAGLVASTLLGASIAAPQLAASVDWAMQSGRIADNATSERYDFSVPPWHWLEFFVADVSGRLFPINSRLTQAISGDGRTWAVTLYAGIIGVILCISHYTTRGLRRLDLWDWLLPIGLLFSMAWPYWILVNVVPGYEAFRYPAKWLSIGSLGFAMTAVRSMDSYFGGETQQIRSISMFVVALTLAIAVVSLGARFIGAEEAIDSLQIVDRFWGPLRVDVAMGLVVRSAVVAAGFAVAFWGLLRLSELERSEMIARLAALAIISLDLFVSARSQIATVSIEAERQVLDAIFVDLIDIRDSQREINIEGPNMWPAQWRSLHNGENRILEVEISQRATRFGRWHLSARDSRFNSVVSIVPQRNNVFWNAMNQMDFRDASGRRVGWSRLEQWLGIDQENHATSLSVSDASGRELQLAVIEPSRNNLETKVYRWDKQWRATDPIKSASTEQMLLRLIEITGGAADSPPIVEGATSHFHEDSGPEPMLRLFSHEDDHLTFRITTPLAGLLTVKTLQDGHWHVKLSNVDSARDEFVEPKRTDFLFMSVEIPAGDWEVTWFYWPWWLTTSLTVAAIATCFASALLTRPGHR